MTLEKDSGKQSKFKWLLNWKICLFSITLLPLLIVLGFWQLHRAEEKHTLQDLLDQQQDRPPLHLSAVEGRELQDHDYLYRQVRMEGKFDTQKVWLLENQVWQGRVGYQVIAPFHLHGGGAVLVNLGWLASTGYRDDLPSLPPLDSVTTVTGTLVRPSINTLLKQQKLTDQWPQPILQIEIEQLQQVVDTPLLAWVLQIESQHPAALAVNWRTIQMPASKHLGYAWQWFAMAVALLVLTVFANSNLGQVLSHRDKK